MEEEKFFSGYCRRMDCSRMVAVVVADGQIDEVECDYGSCPYQSGCPIAAEIGEMK